MNSVILQGYPSTKNLWTGIHLKGFVTSMLTEPRKRRNQNTFLFLQSFLNLPIGVSGNGSVLPLVSRDTLK